MLLDQIPDVPNHRSPLARPDGVTRHVVKRPHTAKHTGKHTAEVRETYATHHD